MQLQMHLPESNCQQWNWSKEKFGANAIFAVSMAICRAGVVCKTGEDELEHATATEYDAVEVGGMGVGKGAKKRKYGYKYLNV